MTEPLPKSNSGLTEQQCLELIRSLMEFPNATICRHFVAANILDKMERNGFPLTKEFAAAVVNAEDEEALRILETEHGIVKK